MANIIKGSQTFWATQGSYIPQIGTICYEYEDGNADNILKEKHADGTLDYDSLPEREIDGSAVWGSITGTLSAQTDLQNALNAANPPVTTGLTTLPALNYTANAINEITQSGDIEYADPITGTADKSIIREDIILGNSTNTITWNVTGVTLKGDSFDATKRNTVITQYLNGLVLASNTVSDLPDVTAPSITGFTIAADNTYIDVEFNEGVYGTGGIALTSSEFSVTDFSQNGDDVTAISIGSVTKTGGGALTGGESTIRVIPTLTGAPSTGLATCTITVVNFEDAAGNETATDRTSTITLNDTTVAEYTDITFASTSATASASTNTLTSNGTIGVWDAMGLVYGSFKTGSLSGLRGTTTGDVQGIFASETNALPSPNILNLPIGLFVSGADGDYNYRDNSNVNIDSDITHQVGDIIGIEQNGTSLTYFYIRSSVRTDIATITVTDVVRYGIFALNAPSESINNCQGLNF